MSECMHGNAPPSCPICHKTKSKCDFGDCEEPATHHVRIARSDDQALAMEIRPMCEKHADFAKLMYGKCSGDYTVEINPAESKPK